VQNVTFIITNRVIRSHRATKSPQKINLKAKMTLSSSQPGLKLDGLELENQRRVAISSERGCRLSGLCRKPERYHWCVERNLESGQSFRMFRVAAPYQYYGKVAPTVNGFDGRCMRVVTKLR